MAHGIAIFLWLTLSTVAFLEYREFCQDLSFGAKFVVITIFIIGGPFFAVAEVLSAILDCILPSGWDEDDRHDTFG